MILLALLLGIALPALTGWLLLDLVEWKTPVLGRGEKWVLGFVLGLTFMMFCAFFANILIGIPFTIFGFLGVFCAMLIALGIPWYVRGKFAGARHAVLRDGTLPRPMIIGLIILGAWVALRIVAFGGIALTTPSFFDDTTDNWNLRGKIFFIEKTFTLEVPWGGTSGVHSYPPPVSLAKTWLSTIAGTWNEGLVNSIHTVWFIALLLLVYWALRRTLPWFWAALGSIILASLPLELIHGTNAYADVFLSVHLFAAVMLMLNALREEQSARACSWLRLSLLAIVIVPFTKNEGWALYLPTLLLLLGGTFLWLWKQKTVTTRDLIQTGVIGAAMLLLCIAPWIGFKLLHGLDFGNAKGIDLNFQWHENVLTAISVNTFLEGNWNLLFPLFFGLLIYRFRTAFLTPLLLLTACFLIPYCIQLFFYLFTGLAQEALLQTGYARGLIHLMPVVVTLTVLLIHDAMTDYGFRMADTTKEPSHNP